MAKISLNASLRKAVTKAKWCTVNVSRRLALVVGSVLGAGFKVTELWKEFPVMWQIKDCYLLILLFIDQMHFNMTLCGITC